MKNIFKPSLLPGFTIIAGLIGLVLRFWLFATGVDEKGLLAENHPAGILTFILTALVMVVLFLCVRPLVPMAKFNRLFPAWSLAGVGCIVAALGIIYVDIGELLQVRDTITVVTLVVGILAAVCLVILSYFRWKGQRPNFLLQSGVCVYFMLHLVSQYRLWSAEPQLQVYFFPLLASVFLMLTAYHGAVLDAQKGSRRWYVFCNQAALFFCCLSLNGESWPFYATMGIWMATSLCSLKPKRTRAPREEA